MTVAEPVTTHISADSQKLYESTFFGEHSRATATQPGSQSRSHAELWRQVAPIARHPSGYDPTIIRFYEDVIAELQRELAKYKTMVIELLKTTAIEEEVEYSPGQKTALPPEVASRLRPAACRHRR
jgi:hypothetical protein